MPQKMERGEKTETVDFLGWTGGSLAWVGRAAGGSL